MFADKELKRKNHFYSELYEEKSNQQLLDENEYLSALQEGKQIPFTIEYVRDKLKNQKRKALEFEKAQFEQILQNRAPSYPEVFMAMLTDRMINTRCGLKTAVELEIQELEYILNNFNEYYIEWEESLQPTSGLQPNLKTLASGDSDEGEPEDVCGR